VREADAVGQAVSRACHERTPEAFAALNDLFESGLGVFLNEEQRGAVFSCFASLFRESRASEPEIARSVEVCAKVFSEHGRVRHHEVADGSLALVDPLFQETVRLAVMGRLVRMVCFLVPVASLGRQVDVFLFLVRLGPRIGLYDSFPHATYMECFKRIVGWGCFQGVVRRLARPY